MTDAIRCTYCLSTKPAASFAQRGDHVIPESLGGTWVDPKACDDCNRIANSAADELIIKDALVRSLRDAYQIRNKRGDVPPPYEFSVDVPSCGVVHVTLASEGAAFEARMSPAGLTGLGLPDPSSDQEALSRLVSEIVGVDVAVLDSIGIARIAQQQAKGGTPPTAWSRFMAKVGLACGRDAYGDAWLDSRQAAILSRDVLESAQPVFSQRLHYPPVERVWPFEPPKHQLWIEYREGTACVMVALFGQILGAVPVSDDEPPPGCYSAWIFDPVEHSFRRSSYPAIWFGTAVARLTRQGYDVMSLGDRGIFIPDGPRGPAELPIPTMRADSPSHAFKLLMDAYPSAGRRDAADRDA